MMATVKRANGVLVLSVAIFAMIAGIVSQDVCGDYQTINGPVHQNLFEGSQKFSLNFFKRVSALVDNDESVTTTNIIISPLSVWNLLALLSEGAEGETLQQILKVMNVKQQSLIRHNFKTFQNAINVKSAEVNISSAQFMFTDKNHPVRQDFEHSIDTCYGHNLFEALDFSSSAQELKKSYDHINKVVADATNNKITRAISPSNLDKARLLLLSVLFFQGEWTFPFNRSLTNESAPFYNEQEKIVTEVPLMFLKTALPFAAFRELDAQVVELPYGTDRHLSMLVILPRKGVPLHEVVRRLADIDMQMIFSELKQAAEEYEDDEVEVFLPRFQISSDYNLNSVLYSMGLEHPLQEKLAQFDKIASGIYVNGIFQKNKIIVNEEGTTAASVAAAVFVNKATPPRFIANRPFAFLIVDKRYDLILFVGQVKDPMKL